LLLSYSFQLIEPPALAPNAPLRVALSLKFEPTTAAAGSCAVVISGAAFSTVTGSAAQPLEASRAKIDHRPHIACHLWLGRQCISQ